MIHPQVMVIYKVCEIWQKKKKQYQGQSSNDFKGSFL
jgi:hypothetical protein